MMKKFTVGMFLLVGLLLNSATGAQAFTASDIFGVWTGTWTIHQDFWLDSNVAGGVDTAIYVPVDRDVVDVVVTLHALSGGSYGTVDVLEPSWYDGVVTGLGIDPDTGVISATAVHYYSGQSFYSAVFTQGLLSSGSGGLMVSGWYAEEVPPPAANIYTSWGQMELTKTPVPEPSTLALLGAGLVGAAALRLRNKKK